MSIQSYELTAQIRLHAEGDTGYRFASGVKTTVAVDQLMTNLFTDMAKCCRRQLKVKVSSISNLKVVKSGQLNGYAVTIHCYCAGNEGHSELVHDTISYRDAERSYGFVQLFAQLQEVAETLNPDFAEIVHFRITPITAQGQQIRFSLE